MYERVKRLYQEGGLTDKGLEKAVKLGWITNEQKEEILSSK